MFSKILKHETYRVSKSWDKWNSEHKHPHNGHANSPDWDDLSGVHGGRAASSDKIKSFPAAPDGVGLHGDGWKQHYATLANSAYVAHLNPKDSMVKGILRKRSKDVDKIFGSGTGAKWLSFFNTQLNRAKNHR